MRNKAPDWVPAGQKADWLALRKQFGGDHASQTIRERIERIKRNRPTS